MRFLFVHQNFPGQFRHLAPALRRRGHDVAATTMRAGPQTEFDGVALHRYAAARGSTQGIHPWVADFETKTIRAEAAFRHARALQAQGLEPDTIVAHPGWGESLFLKDVWPKAKLGIYCEFYYRAVGGDADFDPEFARNDASEICRLRLKNLNNDLHLAIADGGLSPTSWQASTFPDAFRGRIAVAHDGIDTAQLAPDETARVSVSASGVPLTLTRDDEIVTYVARDLEPYRGFHVFMRALPALLAMRPQARVLIVGGDGVSYGAPRADGRSWKDAMIAETRPRIPDADWARVHFLGRLPYADFVRVLSLSRAHVYLTYPFVLSWSLLEAMSIGCPIVASDTAPVREAIRDGDTGLLVDFFAADKLAATVAGLLADRAFQARLGKAARGHALATYDRDRICLPRQIAWAESVA
jgi:glycosyltransferase involved in cell wall biosynthesis